jgi:hypothetical protein
MNSENGHGALSVLEKAGVCQSSRCCGVCANMRLGCARLLPDKLLIAARTTTAPAIDDAVRSEPVDGLSGRSKVALRSVTEIET